MFYNSYQIKTNQRKRIRIPSVFMKSFHDEKIVIEKNIFLPCIDIMPSSVFEEKMESIKKRINIFTKEGERLITALVSNFHFFEAGKQNLILPTDFYNHLNIKEEKELILIGMGKTIRLMKWNYYEKEFSDRERFMDVLDKFNFED